jgi:hypothetical protein
LAQHGLLEIQTGSSVLNPQSTDPSLSQDGSNSSDPVMGSVEIAILGMALAVFFGALVAVVSILCIRAKRFIIISIYCDFFIFANFYKLGCYLINAVFLSLFYLPRVIFKIFLI